MDQIKTLINIIVLGYYAKKQIYLGEAAKWQVCRYHDEVGGKIIAGILSRIRIFHFEL